MKTVELDDAQAQFEDLLGLVSEGDEVIITRSGRPVAKLVPFREAPRRRIPDRDKGRIWIADDFNAWTPDLEKDFFGDEGSS